MFLPVLRTVQFDKVGKLVEIDESEVNISRGGADGN